MALAAASLSSHLLPGRHHVTARCHGDPGCAATAHTTVDIITAHVVLVTG